MPFNSITDQQRFILIGIICLIAGTAIFFCCLAIYPRDTYSSLTLWTETENDVEAEIRAIRLSSGRLILAGTFTPIQQQFYLGSKDLPKHGLKGFGRPTLLKIIASDSIRATGPLREDRVANNLNMLDQGVAFPVYPAGPVTLGLPIELIGNSNAISAEVAITYMACNEKICSPPVINKLISIEIPASFFED